MTASQQVLTDADLVRHILDRLVEDVDVWHRPQVLSRLCHVNKAFVAEAGRLMYKRLLLEDIDTSARSRHLLSYLDANPSQCNKIQELAININSPEFERHTQSLLALAPIISGAQRLQVLTCNLFIARTDTTLADVCIPVASSLMQLKLVYSNDPMIMQLLPYLANLVLMRLEGHQFHGRDPASESWPRLPCLRELFLQPFDSESGVEESRGLKAFLMATAGSLRHLTLAHFFSDVFLSMHDFQLPNLRTLSLLRVQPVDPDWVGNLAYSPLPSELLAVNTFKDLEVSSETIRTLLKKAADLENLEIRFSWHGPRGKAQLWAEAFIRRIAAVLPGMSARSIVICGKSCSTSIDFSVLVWLQMPPTGFVIASSELGRAVRTQYKRAS